MKRLLTAFALVLLAGLPSVASAAGVQVASDIATPPEAVFVDNQYFVGGRVDASGTMEQDTLLLGGRTDFSGTAKGDLLIFGGEHVLIDGIVEGDARILGGTVEITGTMQGDLIIVGGTVRIAPEAVVNGELMIVGGQVTADTTLKKHARIVAASVLLGGTIETSANITTQRFELTDTAHVPGSIVYFAPQEVYRPAGADVSGTLNFNKIETTLEHGVVERAVVNFLNFWIVLRFVTTLMLAFLLVYIFRVFSQTVTEYVLRSFGTSMLIGTGVLFLMPITGVVLLASLILSPVAVLLALFYIAALIISSAVAAIAVGALVIRSFSKTSALEVSFRGASLGVVLLTVVQFVPFVGEATRIVFFLVALGAVWKYIYEHIRRREIALFKQQ
jgi:cytoskeletal protein CcmA (bactofilin family)